MNKLKFNNENWKYWIFLYIEILQIFWLMNICLVGEQLFGPDFKFWLLYKLLQHMLNHSSSQISSYLGEFHCELTKLWGPWNYSTQVFWIFCWNISSFQNKRFALDLFNVFLSICQIFSNLVVKKNNMMNETVKKIL